MKNIYNCISGVSISRVLLIVLLTILPSFLLAQQSPSIQTGVTFQWSDTQATTSDPATIESVTIDGTIYNTFVVPTSYELTRLGPDGHSPNRIRLNGANFGGNSSTANWNTNAISAFQDKNLNHYFTAIPNGRDICLDFDAIETTDSQKQTLFYSPAIPANNDGVLAITERGANNCFYVEIWGTPPGGGFEQKLGETFVRNSGNYRNCTFGVPETGSDYWKSGRCNDNGQTIGIGLFYLSDIAPIGSLITRIEFIGASRDHGDGKFFLLQKYAVDQQDVNCIDQSYSGDLNLVNNVPENSVYSLISGPTPAGQSFVLNADGTYSYTSSPGFTGDVTFEYEVCLPEPNTSVCDQATVTISFVPEPPITETIIASCGTNSDSFTISVTNPLGPQYEYSLNGGPYQSSPDFNDLTEGFYTVNVVNIFSTCETINPDAILLDFLELSGTVTDVLCRLGNTGAIDINVSGGNPPYTFEWSNAAITEDLSDLSAGTYTVIATDANGCSISEDFTINQPDEGIETTVSITDVICFGESNGAIDITVNGGVPPYTFNWNTGETSEDLIDLSAGIYEITITDANGCTTSQEVNVQQPSEALTASITEINNLTCEITSSGDITLSAAGGTAPYSYSIDGGLSSQSSGFFDNLAEGNYEFLIEDTNGCTVNISASLITQPNDNPEISVPALITIEGCSTSDIDNGFPFSIVESEDVQTLFASNPDYTASDDLNILNITYIDVVTSTDNCPITILRTFTVKDTCDNTLSVTQTITIEDTTPPTINVPADLTIECTEDESSTNTGFATGSDNCGTVSITQSDSETDGPCGNTKTIVRTWTATDECGNTTSASQTITVEDTRPPILTLPADVTIECGDDTSSTNTGLAKGEDDCGPVTISESDVVTPGCGNTQIIIRTWTTTDNCGNPTSGIQTITVVDTTPPSLNIPSNVTVECNDDTSSVNTGEATATDACGSVTITQSDAETPGTCGNTKTIVRTWTATDECGNTTSADQTITVEDTTPPSIDDSALENINVQCGTTPDGSLEVWLTNNAGATATDTCGEVTWSNNFDSTTDFDCASSPLEVIFIATDECGNATTITATYSIIDNLSPILEVPADVILECNEDTSPNNTGEAVASDDCSIPALNYSDTEVSTCGNTKIITRTWTATDACGNITSEDQIITIQDTTPPTFSVPADIIVECDVDATDLTVTGDVTDESDNCSTDLNAIFSDTMIDGTCPNTSIITRTWSLTDACNNITTLVQTITVQDTTPPVIDSSGIENINIQCGITPDGTLETWLSNNAGATANDACGNVSWSNDYDSNTDANCSNNPITVIFTATDDCGNTATTSATYSIIDEQTPSLTIPGNLTIECGEDTTPINTGEANATDDCSTPTVTYSDTEIANCGNTKIITRTWTAEDSCGNTTSADQIITVENTTAPTFSAPADISIECDVDISDLTITGDVTDENDNCSSDLEATFTDSIVDGNCPNSSVITRTWSVTDDCNNTTTLVQTITVQDTTPPSFNEELPADLDAECDTVPEASTLTAIDNCGESSIEFNEVITPGSCVGDYIIERTWIATDSCGNENVHTQIITVQDNTVPTLVTPFDENITVACDGLPEIPSLVFEDSCSNNIDVSFSEVSTQINEFDNYIVTRTWVVTDDCGNIGEFIQNINVEFNNVITPLDTNLCILDEEIDLFDLISGDFSTNGEWSVISGNAIIDGSLFDPESADVGVYTFKYAITEGSCPTEAEVTITLDDECVVLACGQEDVVISKTVTANGDGFNEFFTITGIEDCDFVIELQIFNRWGAEIYKSNNYQNNWQGESHNSSIGSSGKVPTGTYYYIINLKDSGLTPFTGPIYVATN